MKHIYRLRGDVHAHFVIRFFIDRRNVCGCDRYTVLSGVSTRHFHEDY